MATPANPINVGDGDGGGTTLPDLYAGVVAGELGTAETPKPTPEPVVEPVVTKPEGEEGKEGKVEKPGEEGKEKKVEGEDIDPDAPPEIAANPRHQELYRQVQQAQDYLANKEEVDSVLVLVPTKENADFLISQNQALDRLEQAVQSDPLKFARVWRQEYPEAYEQLALTVHYWSMVNDIAYLRNQGDEPTAQAIEDALQKIYPTPPDAGLDRGGDRGAGPRRTAPPDHDLDAREKRIADQEFSSFHQKVSDGFERAVVRRLEPMIEKVGFVTPEQRERAMADIFEFISERMDANRVFTARRSQMWDQAKRSRFDPRHIESLVKTNINEAINHLKPALQQVMKELGLTAKASADAKTSKAGASTRTEPVDAGASGSRKVVESAGGEITPEAEAAIMSELTSQGLTGADLYREFAKRRISASFGA
jgi:hypothetical protein